ncbi:MAG TPA: hypothetical protein VME63_05445 [Dyella sp.]|uniref:hypothetical protein n=1 Tax=Dyella sp. TaxID=1869338 RepID=UPI002BA07A1D|nr:hypothetical protein [Dyella sp.]HTV84826.1 hypothetical protein [Dyella sp.]
MVDNPEKYAWSSYHANALGQHDPLVKPHAQYLSLAPTAEERHKAYRALFNTAIDDDRLTEIRSYIQQQRWERHDFSARSRPRLEGASKPDRPTVHHTNIRPRSMVKNKAT